MGSTAKNKTLRAMVRRQLADDGISGADAKNKNVQAHAFGRVCAMALFTNMAPAGNRYPDGPNDHGIDVYRVFDDGSIAIVQCKYDAKREAGTMLAEIHKVKTFIAKICEEYESDENYDPHIVLKMPASQDALFNAVIALYVRGGIKGVREHISYYYCMAASAAENCAELEAEAKADSKFRTVRIYDGENLVRLYDEHILDLEGVPEVDLGIKQSVIDAARIVFASVNNNAQIVRLESATGRSVHEILAVPLRGTDLVNIVRNEFAKGYNYTRLFSSNVRNFLNNTELNEQIIETIKNDPYHFIDYNNGITIVCSAIESHTGTGSVEDNNVSFKNLVIVNGGQTTANLYNAFRRGGESSDDDPAESIDISNISVMCQIIVEPDKNERKRISIRRNTQKPVTAVDIRATEEKAVLLQAHMKTEGFYLGLKRGVDAPKSFDAHHKCNDFKNYVQVQTAFSIHQPYIARNCGSRILLNDQWFEYILSGDYASSNSPAAYAASVLLLSNYLKTVIADFKQPQKGSAATGKDTTGLIYSALNVLGIQKDMLRRAESARNSTFESLMYNQPIVQTQKGFNDVDLSKPFAQYDMTVRYEPSETAIDLLRPFVNWLYEKVVAESAAAKLPLSRGLRSQIVFQQVASDLCMELSQCTYDTCEKEHPYLRLLKPYSD